VPQKEREAEYERIAAAVSEANKERRRSMLRCLLANIRLSARVEAQFITVLFLAGGPPTPGFIGSYNALQRERRRPKPRKRRSPLGSGDESADYEHEDGLAGAL
jgi:hypothetical protein